MAKYKLNDIAPIKQGVVLAEDKYWLLNLDMVESNTGKIIDYLYVPKEEIGASTVTFDTDNVLYSKLRPYLNKVVLPDRPGYATSEMLPMRPNTDIITREYLTYFLRSPHFVSYINEKTSGAKMPRANSSDLKAVEIECPTIDEQKRITAIFDEVISIIQLRKKELSKLDDLIKARFVEMFGDIKTNEHGWEKCTFKDVSTKITDGEHGTVPRVDESEGYLYFMARNITKEGKIDLSETSFVPRENHEKIYKRCNPEKDDLLLVCVGATIGKCTLVPEIMGEFSMARSVALIKPNKERVTSNFLINLLRSEAIQNDIDHCSHAAAQAGLYTNMINSLEAFVPPMDFQIEFDTFSEQVDKSKVAIQAALDKSQLLFDSLMQKYFG